MATVSGITVARAQEIEDRSIVSAQIQGTSLFLTTFGGQKINAGVVVPTLPPLVAAWPVGSIFMSIRPDNPASANMLGGGTWVRWGNGRVPVSVDSTQVEFAAVEGAGGAKVVRLTGRQSGIQNHTHPLNGHTWSWLGEGNVYVGNGDVFAGTPPDNELTTIQGGWVATKGSGDVSALDDHTNLQPYINVYMWKRTA